MSTVTASAMAPSRPTHATSNKEMAADSGQSRMYHPNNTTQIHPQQQQPPPPSSYRFGAPDSRASYSERRVNVRSSTSHNHPSWHNPHNVEIKSGRSFSSAAPLSRSNGSLAAAASSSAGSNSPANEPTDSNGNSKSRSRTQVLNLLQLFIYRKKQNKRMSRSSINRKTFLEIEGSQKSNIYIYM